MPPTTNRRTGRGIRYGCQLPCFHALAKSSIAFLTLSGRNRANTPKARNRTAISSAAGASARLGSVPCTSTNYTNSHLNATLTVETRPFRSLRIAGVPLRSAPTTEELPFLPSSDRPDSEAGLTLHRPRTISCSFRLLAPTASPPNGLWRFVLC